MIAAPPDIASILGEPIDLTQIDTAERRAWIPGATRFLRPGVPVLLFAPRGDGKSLLALLFGEQVVDAGGSVVYIDFENGERRTAERMGAILAERPDSARQAVSERFVYYPHVRLHGVGDPRLADAWGEALGGFTVVVIDSLARALGQLGLDENSTPDFAKFVVGYVDPLTARGAAVMLLDNTGWDEAERSRGASGKWDLVELVYKVTSDPIAHNKYGHIYLTRKRTRDGDEAIRLEVGVGGGTYTRLEAADRDAHDRELLDAVVSVLTLGGHTSPDSTLGRDRLLKGARERGVKGTDKARRHQLAELAADPTIAVKSAGKGYFTLGESAAQGGLGENPAQVRPGQSESGSTERDSPWADTSPIVAQGTLGVGDGPLGPPTPAPAEENGADAAPPGRPAVHNDDELEGWIRSVSAMPEAEAEREWDEAERQSLIDGGREVG